MSRTVDVCGFQSATHVCRGVASSATVASEMFIVVDAAKFDLLIAVVLSPRLLCSAYFSIFVIMYT